MKFSWQLPGILMSAILFLPISSPCGAQNVHENSPESALKTQQSWHIDCMPKGCIASVDILRGASGDPPNPQDSAQYISVAVGVDGSNRKPSLVMFEVDPHADQREGVELLFAHSVPDGRSWKIVIDPNGPIRLPFRYCNTAECAAVVGGGKADQNQKDECASLVAKMQSESHLFLSYSRDGRPYRTAVSLALFKEAYARLLAQASAVQDNSSAKP